MKKKIGESSSRKTGIQGPRYFLPFFDGVGNIRVDPGSLIPQLRRTNDKTQIVKRKRGERIELFHFTSSRTTDRYKNSGKRI
jgi:hypothetical protein